MWWSVFSSIGNFFKLKWKGILVIVVGLLVVFGVWQWRDDIIQRYKAIHSYEQVAQSLKEQKKALNKLVEENKKIRNLNKKYREVVKEIRKSRLELSYEIEKLQEQNKEVRIWSVNRIPDVVYYRLRNNSTKSSYQNRNQTNSSSKEMDETN